MENKLKKNRYKDLSNKSNEEEKEDESGAEE